MFHSPLTTSPPHLGSTHGVLSTASAMSNTILLLLKAVLYRLCLQHGCCLLWLSIAAVDGTDHDKFKHRAELSQNFAQLVYAAAHSSAATSCFTCSTQLAKQGCMLHFSSNVRPWSPCAPVSPAVFRSSSSSSLDASSWDQVSARYVLCSGALHDWQKHNVRLEHPADVAS